MLTAVHVLTPTKALVNAEQTYTLLLHYLVLNMLCKPHLM